MTTCPDCGLDDGAHGRFCPRRDAPPRVAGGYLQARGVAPVDADYQPSTDDEEWGQWAATLIQANADVAKLNGELVDALTTARSQVDLLQAELEAWRKAFAQFEGKTLEMRSCSRDGKSGFWMLLP